MENETKTIGDMTVNEIDENFRNLSVPFTLPENTVEQQPVPTPEPVAEEQPTIGTPPLPNPGNMTEEEIAAKQEALSTPGGFIGETLKDTGKGLVKDVERAAAVPLGILDTVTDAINLMSADGGKFDIPKVPTFEDQATEALRDISGLIMPMLGIRGQAIKQATRLQKAGVGPKWLQSLGKAKSFEWFAKFGVDTGAGALVDYVAEQNKEDHNLAGTLKKYWPKTYSFIPYTWATGDHHSADQKRDRNIKEGAILGALASVVEGIAFFKVTGDSMSRTAKLVPSTTKGGKSLKALTEDEFTNIVFDADNPFQDNILRGYARKEKALDELGEYYLSKGEVTEPTVGIHDVFDESETLVRTKDPDGILGAMANQAEIRTNVGQYGRLGSITSEAGRKHGLELNNLTNKTLVTDLANQIKKGGKFKKVGPSGATIVSEKVIEDAANHLAATLLHPRLTTKEVLSVLDEFKRAVDDSIIRIVGKKGINKSIKLLKEQITDLDFHKARAFLATSEAGQIADFSEGARLMEDSPESFMRTVDLMADRLEVLMVEKGLAKFEADSMLANMNAWKAATKTGNIQQINQTADLILGRSNDKLLDIIPKVKEYTQTLKDVARENPDFLKPLMLANEFTDGDVDSMFKLHQYAAGSLGVYRKAFIDRNPKVPSIINKAAMSNLFNSTLSAFSTPIKAAVGNLTGLIGKGTATIVGAVSHGDFRRAQKAMTAWWVLDDTLMKSFDHMRLVFRKASTNPKEFAYITRGDIAIKENKSLEVFRAYAESAEKNGEYGASALLRVFDDLEDMSMDPMLRFGGNAMTALDGFGKHVISNVEAKYAAIDELNRIGKPINEANLKAVAEKIHRSHFDANDMISDKTVNAISSEINLNADNVVVEGINNLVQHVPASRPFLMFPKTTANVLDTFSKWSPAGVFSADYHDMWGPFGRKTFADFKDGEIEQIMTRKGRPIDENLYENFEMLRYEVKGKAAIGSFFTTAAFLAGMNGRCTGNGHYDKARQRVRVKNGWQPKSCKVPGTNKYVSYEWMGPIGDWLSLAIDVTDNFDLLSVSQQEEFGQKLMFIFGSAFFNRTNLVQLEPLHDILQGNGAAATRFMSSFLNNTMPMGSMRSELGRLMNPQLRELRNEFDQAIRNRNAWLDMVDPQGALPGRVDYIDGKKVGYQDNWFIRAWNVYSPIKIHDQPSPERQFLIDIEYNSSPQLRISQGGAELENKEITEIHTIMGEQGIYKAELQEIIKDANNIEYNGIKGFVNVLKAERAGGVSSDVLDSSKYKQIFNRINTAYLQAKKLAEDALPDDMLMSIRERELQVKEKADHTTYGNLDQLYEQSYPGLNETLKLAN